MSGLFLKPGRSDAPVVRVIGLDVPVDLRFKGRMVLNPLGNLPQLFVQQLPQDDVFICVLLKAKPAQKPHFLAAGESEADASLETMMPPWLGVATMSMPGIMVSIQSISPQGEKSGCIAFLRFLVWI